MSTAKKWMTVSSLVLLAATLLSACGPGATVVVTQPVEKVVTQVAVTEKPVLVTPTPAPVTRTGAWVDSVIVVEEENAPAAITRLQSGELDLYAYAIADAKLFSRVKESPDLAYAMSYGSYNELTFNPVGPVFTPTNQLNPFSVPRIREAMNWLIDRDYICREIFGGLAVPRYTALNTTFSDYAKLADTARAIELKYAYNPDKAKQVITEEMEKLGATLEGGKWMYQGQPVTIILLIRIEDERKAIGDYVANQLESIGFTTDRQYKKAAEASPIWLKGNPAEGKFHIYTGGWVTTMISRDLADNFDFFYTPRGMPRPLWQAYTPAPEFDEISQKLAVKDFASLEERQELMKRALELSLEDSVRVWLADRVSFSPARANIQVSADLAGSVYGSALWAQTLRRKGEIGGSITMAMPSILTEPWNPIAGSNWIYDMMLIRGTSDAGVVPDPYTGLYWPQRIERAECVVEEGLPVGKTLDWIDLSFAPKIEVPSDAWVDWDPVAQTFITAGEKFTQTQTAKTKCTVYYPADLYKTVKWHDGSNFSAADVVMNMILTFDRAYTQSVLYDKAYVPSFESFMDHFKGVKIVSTDPLVIETYDDMWYLDAEYIVTTWFPYYSQGQAAWHNLVPAILAEGNKELAFSADKSTALTESEGRTVEYTSFIAGPSIDILKKYLVTATNELYVPYAATLGQFLGPDEAKARYDNLNEWVRTKGHFWIGTGPFYLERAFPVEGTVVLKRFLAYPDLATKWERFAEPRMATAEVSGPDSVKIGGEATFDVEVTFKGAPYPIADVDQVKYMVFDAKGNLAFVGAAEAVADGKWQVKLTSDVTSKLEAGSNRLEVAVVVKPVSIPAFASTQFVTAP
ncbi:MAG: ABC transporter substrate-binding protein [Chloroflexia bacterium]